MNKTKYIKVNMTEDQKKRIKQSANKGGYSMSNYMLIKSLKK